jgi:type VI secretion system protein ImpC
MSEAKSTPKATETTSSNEPSLLESVITATKQTERSQAIGLIDNLVKQADAKNVKFDRNLARTIDRAIAEIDEKLSTQLNAIIHDEKFLKLEGSWRGLHYLVINSETSASLKIRMLNVSKRELNRDLTKAVEFDQSRLYKSIYTEEFGMPGGQPYGALIGDFEWTNHPDDIETLRLISNIAAAGFSPFISSAGPAMFGLSDWTELNKPRDLAKIFDGPEYIKWNSFRDSEDARFVSLVMPRVLARLPYGSATKPIGEFGYEEAPLEDNVSIEQSHRDYCWMNAAYAMGARLTDAFAQWGFCVRIRGKEGGGTVENLPTHVFTSEEGDSEVKCPTEVLIPDRREYELSNLGFLPLCSYKNSDYAVFIGGQTVQKPKKWDTPEATANAAISARLPYIMAAGRFAHYLKVMARDKIGSSVEAAECERWLNRWINNYTNNAETAGDETKAMKPLRESKIEVQEIPGKPGAYNAVAKLRPWLHMEELTASVRMVASIPSGNS